MENEYTPEECFDIGMMYLDGKVWDDAFKLLTLSADSGYKKAVNQLYNLYRKQINLKQNHTTMFEFYSREGKGPFSLHYLGYMYASGLGVEQDRNKAIEYYKKNIEFPLSKYCLAINLRKLGFCEEALKLYLCIQKHHRDIVFRRFYLSKQISRYFLANLTNCEKYFGTTGIDNLLNYHINAEHYGKIIQYLYKDLHQKDQLVIKKIN